MIVQNYVEGHYEQAVKHKGLTIPIIYVPIKDFGGGYIPGMNIIFIDSLLKNYPGLHAMTLEHEIGHATKDKNVIDFLKRELKDYPNFYNHPEYKPYMKESRSLISLNWKLQLYLYKIFMILLEIPILIITYVKRLSRTIRGG